MFRIIWSKALGTWVVASELNKGRGKSGGDTARCQALVAGVGISALMLCCSSPVSAQVWKGTTSSDWTVGTNWSTGTAPSGTATVTINTNSPNPTVLGVSGAATGTIGLLQMGTVAGTSALTVQNGSKLSSSVTTGVNEIGNAAGTNTTVTITGAGSSWSTGTLVQIAGPTGSTGTLNVANGASVATASLNFSITGISGGNATLNVTGGSTLTTSGTVFMLERGSTSTANISGPGSQWNIGGFMAIGRGRGIDAGSGVLNVTNGGVVTAAGFITIAGNNLSGMGTGTATITGAGSQLNTSADLGIGAYGNGTLTISNGASATANTVTMTAISSSKATLNVSGASLLATQALTAGPGTVQANFDSSTLRATASNAAFVSGFSGTQLNLAAGGLTLDTGGFNVTATSPFSGTGALTKIGNGTAVFTGENTYAGGTTISAGTLQLGNGGTSGSVAGNVANNGTLAFNRSDVSIYNGQISGTGAVSQIGNGTTILGGNNTYLGGTAINGGTLQVAGDANLGSTSGALSFNGGTLQTTADFASSRAVTLNANGGTFQTTGNLTLSSAIGGTGALTKTDVGTLLLTGNNTYTGGTTISAGTLQLGNGGTSGAIAGDVSNNGTLAFDRSDTVMFGSLISGTGAVNQIGTGATILAANNTYTGATAVTAGTLAVGDASHPQATIGSGNVSVASGAALGGYGQIAGSVQNSGTLAAANALPLFATGSTGTLQIGGAVTNGGTLQLAAANGSPGNVLHIAGNYTGSGNSRLVLNTVFNQGGAASQTDRLVVGGNVSGSTAIALNRLGTGAQTVGDGIQLVQVGGTSATNSFRLASPVQAGAYQYMLYQGGSTDSNSWYLRSQLEQAAASPADSSASPGGSTPPATGAATHAAAGAAVAYRPGVVGYSVTPLLNADYGFTVLGRQHERVGDEVSSGAMQAAHSDGVWGRIGGQSVDADAGSRFSADERTFFAQFGKDWTLGHDSSGGSTHAGATVTFGSTSASFSDNLRSITGQLSNATGTVETQAQSVGGYWTRYLPDGAYVDAVGQLTHYQNRYGDVFGDSASQNGFGAGISGEVGKPFALGATGAALEPQAQLLYQYLHLNGFSDGVSQVGANSTNGLRGRLGFRLFKANLSNDSKTSNMTPWFTADVLHDFVAPGQTSVGGTPFDNRLGRTWYELGVGITGSFGKRSTVYADVRYARNAGGDYRRTVFGQAGYRFNW
jgi:outer membrane autotransporter protein